MAKLPISRAVDVTVTRQDNFPTRRGFGTPLIIHNDATGPLDANNRTKVYGSIEEVAADYGATTAPYLKAQTLLSQPVSPKQFKLGFREGTEITLAAELDAIAAFDSDWYWVLFTNELRDNQVAEDAIAAWAQVRACQAFIESNAVGHEDPANVAVLGARLKGQFDRVSGFYHTDAGEDPAAVAAAYTATRNFDQTDSAYTLKFKRGRAIAPVNVASAAVQAITGFQPDLGLNTDAGHFMNTYVDIGGSHMFVEGNTLHGAFIDEMHMPDWMRFRIQETLLGILAINDRVPYSEKGVDLLRSGVEEVMNRAVLAGLIADVEDAETGEFLPAYSIESESVESIPASQRRNRIAPNIIATFRYAGAMHYASARVTITF